MPIFFNGKEFTNIGSIRIKDKKKASRITNIKCKLGGRGGGRSEIREKLTPYPSKITKQKTLQFLV